MQRAILKLPVKTLEISATPAGVRRTAFAVRQEAHATTILEQPFDNRAFFHTLDILAVDTCPMQMQDLWRPARRIYVCEQMTLSGGTRELEDRLFPDVAVWPPARAQPA